MKSTTIWQPDQAGRGRVEMGGIAEHSGHLRLIKEPPADGQALQYSNAQIDDYQPLRRSDFLWHPPVRLSLRARFSHPAARQFDVADRAANAHLEPNAYLSGTAGFGFWNDPFMMTGFRRPTLPRAIWFFYSSPPSNMQLALGVPGWGWKAAVIDCLRPAFYSLLPTAPVGVLLMRSNFFYRNLWPIAQRAINVEECPISTSLTEWHRYELMWDAQHAEFWVDGVLVGQTKTAPRGPLGLVIWLDNQFMVVKPTGRFQSGLVPSDKTEVLEVEEVRIS